VLISTFFFFKYSGLKRLLPSLAGLPNETNKTAFWLVDKIN
jgi:hypothetical protein